MTLSVEERLLKIEESLSLLVKSIGRFDEIIKNQSLLQGSVDIVKKELLTSKTNYNEMKKEIGELKKSVNFLLAENLVHKQEIKNFRNSIEESARSALAQEAIISGVSKQNKTGLKDLVIQIADKAAVKIKDHEIVEVLRINGDKDEKRMLKVKFKSVNICKEVVKNGRKRRLKNSDLDSAMTNDPIFVNEALSPYNKKVFFEARKLKKDLSFKFCWVSGGRVFLRKNENEKPILISNLEDIATIKK